MSTDRWGEKDDSHWQMYASAEDEGRVYQAGGDQHITEFHFHGSGPTPDGDDEDEDDEDWGYYEASGGAWDDIWENALNVLLSLAPLLPLAIAGASTRAVWTDKLAPSAWWCLLYSLGAAVVGFAGLAFLRRRVYYRSYLIGRLAWLYTPLSIGVFVYYAVRDPAHTPLRFIEDLGLWFARKLGPL